MTARAEQAHPQRSWLPIPSPVRDLFKLFPLAVLPAEALPHRAPEPVRTRPRLHVFARGGGGENSDGPSFNPSCLKWQTFLRIAGVEVDIVPSNNHASPSGSLPYLLPPNATTSTTNSSSTTSSNARPLQQPLTGQKIGKYARDYSTKEIPTDISSRSDAYEALIAQNIRPAWLYYLYLHSANLPVLTSLYLPRSPLLRPVTLSSLRSAATLEIQKSTRRPLLSAPHLLAAYDTALHALATLLSSDDWFFAAEAPGLFDAEVFAYTHLILDEGLGWTDEGDELGQRLRGFENLVAHRKRLYQWCWPRKAE